MSDGFIHQSKQKRFHKKITLEGKAILGEGNSRFLKYQKMDA
jgi:hypothetical protein